MAKVQIQGLTALQRKLRALPVAAQAALKPVMEEVAERVVQMARSLVPTRSGRLKKSIGWTWGEAPLGSIVIGTVKARERGYLTITIFAGGPAAFYARWVEFGTSPHINEGKFAGTKHPGTRAQPFFYPSWRAQRRSAKSKITRAITRSARKVANGGK